MVAIPTAEINETAPDWICPSAWPDAIKIKENSDIWAPVIEVRNDVRLRNPKDKVIAKNISGLPINIKSDKIKTCEIEICDAPVEIEAPKRIKKITIKKSRNGLTLAEIWIR